MTETKIYETARAAACWVRQQVDDGQRFSLRAADDLLGCSVLVADLPVQICGQVVRHTTSERIQSIVDEHHRRRRAMNPLRRMLTPQMPPSKQIERARHRRQASILLGSHLSTGNQRVVHAHMLGHIVERMVAGQRTGYSFSPDTPDQCPPLPPMVGFQVTSAAKPSAHELFADEFAMALLMPPHLLGRLPSDPRDAQEQAGLLHVSPRSLRRWHERLQQDPWNRQRIEEIVPIVDDAVRAARG